MLLSLERCNGCEVCLAYCPTGAISMENGQAQIDRDLCVECYNCHRLPICPNHAFEPEELEWPRSLRRALSDPITVDNRTGVSGRGTAEMKTNDVTGRIRYGHFGIGVELGRPGVGTRMTDVEKVCRALAPYVAFFEPKNPVTYVMTDTKTGALRDDVKNELVLSAIVEADVAIEQMEPVLRALKQAAGEVDTVFSVGLSSRVYPEGGLVFDEQLAALKLSAYPGGKTNVGLARPAFVEELR
jgi:NAD-dependent dihydropyrimidine dehydrogenase PreA subunit